jgi:hypothetical protein
MPHPPVAPPPMSTSSLPASKRIPLRIPAVKPPVLASDILREEIAPEAPARKAIRMALLAFSMIAVFGALAATARLGRAHLVAPWALEGAIAAAVLAATAAFAPLPYAGRAALAALGGALLLGLGADGAGPLARLGDDGLATGTAMGVMATVLPAALVFRSRYRAFRAARIILGVALVVSVPAVALLALSALDSGQPIGERWLAGIGVVAAAAGTLGFMGPETSGGCAQWAALVVGAYAARPTWRAVASAWSGRDQDTVALTATAIGALAASTLVTFAIFQLFAAALARQARKVDVHRALEPAPSEPDARSNSGFED